MRLEDLLRYDDIVIQCHDNPDADALASGYAVYWYLTSKGKSPRFIYRGSRKVTKSNLLIMISELNIPVKYDPDFDGRPELLITVDCQPGQKNISTLTIRQPDMVIMAMPILIRCSPNSSPPELTSTPMRTL